MQTFQLSGINYKNYALNIIRLFIKIKTIINFLFSILRLRFFWTLRFCFSVYYLELFMAADTRYYIPQSLHILQLHHLKLVRHGLARQLLLLCDVPQHPFLPLVSEYKFQW